MRRVWKLEAAPIPIISVVSRNSIYCAVNSSCFGVLKRTQIAHARRNSCRPPDCLRFATELIAVS